MLKFAPGDYVAWKNPYEGWKCGKFIGLAPGDSGEGDPFVAVQLPQSVVHLRQSALV